MIAFDALAPSQASLTAKEIAAILGITKRSAQRRASLENWPAIDENGNGGRVKKYLLNGLPEEIRLLMSSSYNNKDTNGAAQAGAGEPDHLPTGIPSSQPAGAATPAGPSGKDLAVRIVCPGLTKGQSAIAAARYDLVTEYIKAKAAAGRKGAGLCRAAADFCAAYNTGLTHKELFDTLGTVSWKTLEKWHRTIKISGHDFSSVAPRYGQHRRGIRVVTTDEMNKLLEFALTPNGLRISQAIRWTKRVLADLGLPSPSSDATLRRALMDWKDANFDRWTFCRKGEKALADEVLPYLERDDRLLEVGDVLVADGHTLNFQVINPYTGKPCRPTLLMFQDWASRYPAGWYIMMTENVQCIHAALRRAILNLGKIPKWVLIDNGKAFKAKHFRGTADFEQAGFRGLYARLGIQTHFATPYNAKAKPVERFFGTFNELERLLPSYTGRNIDDKPAYMRRNEKLHKRLHSDYVPTIEQADTIIRGWAWDAYAGRPHRGIRGAKPGEIWEAGKGPGVDDAGLRYLMMSIDVKTVHRNGITLFGINFYDEALYGYRKAVQVRHDILDFSHVYIYSEDGSEYICEAKPVRSVHPLAKMTGNPIDLEGIREGVKLQKRLKRSTEAESRMAAAQIGPWPIPGTGSIAALEMEDTLPMTPAQIEDIETQAAQTEVIHLDEIRQPELASWEGETYERLLEKRAKGGDLSAGEHLLMTEFEQTDAFRMLQGHYRSLEEGWIMKDMRRSL